MTGDYQSGYAACRERCRLILDAGLRLGALEMARALLLDTDLEAETAVALMEKAAGAPGPARSARDADDALRH